MLEFRILAPIAKWLSDVNKSEVAMHLINITMQWLGPMTTFTRGPAAVPSLGLR